ncbi:MAG: type II secretion system protein [Desulfomonilia bacterium]|jgi:prepilin-type N-terminal cleavage/methylation domain-containing protein|uniref:Prepilin-type N-terminal cleavage/methylation domain-containing protein n=1 Tax=anaerobic digester metagenome TaxID=1263854 RepID=A0A485M4U6_9ZZZZ|nr:prepilin-type N-terminal cleavage/methylation domain-containing protein [Pseudomonadota bacterium]HPD21841.1 prepilin-type N-terminal cleavage/methylation domain-containing protein [Deltaproteobacteria bacterium]HPX17900.1 prepilin-type N-terminal cleavage/methylation domain-containing protein [Deltaproteobacteria bacterium]HRS55937.1 prepilin-type N-terminal cleavage/methylation domain-containing protein [Desulfomonilia bacterium]HRV35637.1 prepilin-type N-terminal cleavage/methylation doma
MRKPCIRDKHGFTLVELALVLVIVGLLITGVLKGEALIENAKVKKLVNQKDSIAAAYYTYFDRYGMLPGDENQAGTPTGDTHEGDGDGQIDAAEYGYVFEDLVLAGIINGSYDGTPTDLPNHAFGDFMRIQWVGNFAGSAVNANCMYFNGIPAQVALQIDTKYDDGVYNSGSIRSNTIYTNQAPKQMIWRM